MKQTACVMGCMLLTSVACATTNTWDGGSTVDSNWSSAENWSPDGAPVSASDTYLKFDGGARLQPVQNIAAPFLLNRLDFLGGATYTTAFTIGGGQLQFVTNGVTHPRIYLNRNATCVITNAVDIPDGTTLFAEIGTYGVELRGPVTGGGGIDKQSNAGGLSLNSSANTFSGGLIVRANNGDWAKVNINASQAMGTGPVSLYGGSLATNLVNPGGLNFYNTTTHTNPISLFATSPIFAAMPNGNNANVTLNGNIDLNTYTLHLRGGGAGTIGGVIAEGAATALIKSDAGSWTLNAANSFQGRIVLLNGTLRFGAGGSLAPEVALAFACTTGWSFANHATFDLNGRNQTVSQLSGTPSHAFYTNILTSATAATLTVDQAAGTLFNGRLTGALGLVKAGAGTLTLSNYLSDTIGPVTVSNGTLALASGASLGNATNVTVSGGALALQTAAALADHATLRIDDGATVSLAGGVTETVGYLILNGVPQPRGYYGSPDSAGAMFVDDAHFDGTGLLYVSNNPPLTPTAVTWDAGGENLLLSTADNWVGNAVPAFDGSNRAVFAEGGATATVDVAATFYGMTFNRDGAFTLGAGSGVISNAAGGLFASAPNTTPRTYTILEDLVLTDHQTWFVGTNTPGVTALSVRGVIDDGLLPCNILKSGFGALTLSASNTFDGSFTVNEGDLTISHAQALGSTNGSTVINGSMGGRLFLNGNMTITEPLILNGERNNAGTLYVVSGSNVLSGALVCSNQVRFNNNGNPLVVSGGVTADNNGLFVINAGATVTFTDKPLNLGTRTFWADSGGTTVLAVPGNTWGDTMLAGGTLRCEVPNALPPSSMLRLGVWYSPSGTLDLRGNDQTVGKFYLETSVSASRTVTSATPACLTVNQNDNTLIDARFTGAVSLLKAGSGTLTLTNAFTSTTGSFTVTNGTLAVTRDGTFGPNSTNIFVLGAGTLALSNSVAIADTATVWMPPAGVSTAKINLNDGVNEKVGWLFYGGKMQRAGTYGSSSSSAAHKDDTLFAGKGVLTVRFSKSGTLFSLL
ncbi:MAG TPA: autotransporter-associated beta strand repeat-containing protein [Kiritimatiellia bacterium]|nr:autotransporter-associated beta strand repeat-containing protein [Kiritimatiellia bacterium]